MIENEKNKEKEILIEYKNILKNKNKELIKNIDIKNENKKENKKEINNEINKLEEEKLNNQKNKEKIYKRQYISPEEIIEKNKNGKIVSIAGANGIGKSIFSMILAREVQNKKVAIVDFDVLTESLHTILGITDYERQLKERIKIINQNKYDEKNKKIFEKVSYQKIENKNKKINDKYFFNINDFIIKTKYNIDLISGLNLIFEIDEKIKPEKIKRVFRELRKNYDIVIIDTSTMCFMDYTREIFRISDEIIFISGANLMEVKKSEKLLQIYTNIWNIEKNKLRIIFNKCTKNSIEINKLNKIFSGYKILGKIKLSDFYDYLINDQKSNLDEIKKELREIASAINKEKNKYFSLSKTD